MNIRSVALAAAMVCGAMTAIAHDESVTATQAELGRVQFKTSCSAEAQAQFERALAMLHSFWFTEAGKQFEAVLAKDPNAPSPTGASR